MKTKLLSLFALFAVCGPLFAADPSKSAFTVATDSGSGSGIVVKGGESSVVLTNKHVVEGRSGVWVVVEGKLVAAKEVVVDPADDLAIVVVGVRLPAVPLAESEPAAGEKVVAWGRMSGPCAGKVERVCEYVGKPSSLLTTCLSLPGDSGGGVCDAEGRLVAVNWGRHDGVSGGLQAGVRLPAIRDFLRRAGK